MELWVFDRSGPYSSGEFDIHEEPKIFIQSLAGYAHMSDKELGLDTFIQRRAERTSITPESDARGKKRKLQLDAEPFVRQRATVCRGTTCFRTTDQKNVVKFSWTSDKRLFGCLGILPAGRALNKFGSIRELLTALRDAIRAHRSLYIEGDILHRDVSENNIIITNPKTAKGFTGMLIDLDLAKIVGSGKTGARHQTGTVEFMAIQVLRKVAHTYRHDLESFFYVLLWICGRRCGSGNFNALLINDRGWTF